MRDVMRRIANHHAQKADMIHHLLKGKSDLRIFEPCAYKVGRKYLPGECSKAYERYADPSQHIKVLYQSPVKETDWLYQTRVMLLAGRKFDVVDLDGYGGPERLLWAGVAEIVDQGGLLFVTFPLKGGVFRYPHSRRIVEAVYGGVPGVCDHLSLVVKAGMACDRMCELVSIAVYDDKVVRAAYRVTKLTSIRARMREVMKAASYAKALAG